MRSTTIENGRVPEGLEGGTRGDGKRGPNVKDTYTAHIPIVAMELRRYPNRMHIRSNVPSVLPEIHLLKKLESPSRVC